jgi:hypothetical protein
MTRIALFDFLRSRFLYHQFSSNRTLLQDKNDELERLHKERTDGLKKEVCLRYVHKYGKAAISSLEKY